MNDLVVAHKHYTMGVAPYFLVGIWSCPSPSLQEHNPNAYNLMMDSRPKCCHMSCDHCGTGIMHHFILKDANGKNFCVGSSCIDKLGQVELITQAKAMEKKRQKALRAAKLEQKRADMAAVVKVKQDAERTRNGGLTDIEVNHYARFCIEEAFIAKFVAVFQPIDAVLDVQPQGDFIQSIRQQASEGCVPSKVVANILCEIMGKQFGRKGSKAYSSNIDEQSEMVEEIIYRLNTLRTEYREDIIRSHK